MSEPALTISPSDPALSADGWIDLKEAARRATLSSDAVLRHKIKNKGWFAAGLARVHKPANGKAIWLVHESADVRFCRVKPAEPSTAAWSGKHLSALQRQAVLDKVAIIVAFAAFADANSRRMSRRELFDSFVAANRLRSGESFSRASLYNWINAHKANGPAGLEDGRAVVATGGGVHPFLLDVQRIWLTEQKLSKARSHWLACELAKRSGGETLPLHTAKRHLCKLEQTNRALVIRMRDGAKAHNDLAVPYLDRDYSKLASNEIWNGDTRTVDVMVNCGGKIMRPFITAWQDVRSRKIVGWHIHAEPPTAMHILLAFRHAVHPHLSDCGVPNEVYVDNGKQYDAWTLQGMTKFQRRRYKPDFSAVTAGGVFGNFGVKVVHCEPYHGQSKPIERFFRTMKDQFCRTWPTFCGGTPEEKPESLLDEVKAGQCPTLDEFRLGFASFVGGYHARGHGGDAMDGRAPQQVWLDCMGVKSVVDADLADIYLLPPQPHKVHQNGVTVNRISYGRNVCVTHKLLGRDVIVRCDPDRAGEVSLWTPDGKFIALAPSNDRIDFRAGHEHVRAALKEKRRLGRVRDQYADARPRLTLDIAQLASRAAASEAEALAEMRPTDPTPPTLRPIQSPLNEGANAYRGALERRQAVGAETTSPLLGNYRTEFSGPEDSGPVLGGSAEYLKFRPSEDRHE